MFTGINAMSQNATKEKTMIKAVKAWHFVAANRKLGYGDSRVVKAGRTYKYKGDEPIELCLRGMHASRRVIDALQYASSNIICRVELSGDIIEGNDKLVATERKVLWMMDCERVMRPFARQCALDVAHLWDMPDIVRRYLETGDESIRDAARAAARDAARAAARDAARAAAWDEMTDKFNANLEKMITNKHRRA